MPDLTALQSAVLELDRSGLKPIHIANTLGISIAQVSNLKLRLRRLGYAVSVHRAASETQHRENYQETDEVYDPGDFELPARFQALRNTDGSYQRCACGLIKEQDHECRIERPAAGWADQSASVWFNDGNS